MSATYNVMVKKDDNQYVGYCIEIPQARGVGDTREEAIEDTKVAIQLCREYIDDKIKSNKKRLVSVSV